MRGQKIIPSAIEVLPASPYLRLFLLPLLFFISIAPVGAGGIAYGEVEGASPPSATGLSMSGLKGDGGVPGAIPASDKSGKSGEPDMPDMPDKVDVTDKPGKVDDSDKVDALSDKNMDPSAGGNPESTPGIDGGDVSQVTDADPFKLTKKQLIVPENLRKGKFSTDRYLNLPHHFKINLFATGLGKARFMATSQGGDIYLSVPDKGRVVVLPDKNGDGVADRVITFVSGLDDPHGIAFDGTDLIVAGGGKVLRVTDKEGDLKSDSVEVIAGDLPTRGGGHWTRSIAIGPDDGRYYVSVGSSCNVCREAEVGRAAVLVYENPTIGTGRGEAEGRVFASGLRNSVGIAFHPFTGELWGSDNGRDWLGDDLPPDELNRITDGGDYGWPYCYGNNIVDDDMNIPEGGAECSERVPPVVEFQAHSAPLGITFGEGLNMSQVMKDSLFVAFHGSWNRSVPTGYKVVRIPFGPGGQGEGPGGGPSGEAVDFITGWLPEDGGGKVWGRPVDTLVGPDGGLYISDDMTGSIYRVTLN